MQEDSEFQIARHIDFEDLSWPGRDDDLTDSAGGNRLYVDLRFMRWSDAKRVLAVEESLLLSDATTAHVQGAGPDDLSDGRGNDEVDAEDEDDDDQLFGLDPGVASTVVALSAARCIPFTSCNGGPGHLELYPLVACWARPQRVLDLLEIAEEAGCGLENDDYGIGAVLVYADDVSKMVQFARILIERRNSLRKVRQAKRPHSGGPESRRLWQEVQAELPFPAEW